MTTVNSTVLYIWKLLRKDLQSCHHTHKHINIWRAVCVNLIVAIILLYVHMLNHYVGHLKLIECYMSIISIKLGEKKENTVIETESRLVIARGCRVEEIGKGGQSLQTSSYKMNVFWRWCSMVQLMILYCVLVSC